MTESGKIVRSRFMSLALRHKPEEAGITLDENGWADTQALIEGMNKKGVGLTLEQMKDIVATNNKQRFKFNDDFTKIRANQGHSVSVDVNLKEAVPPDVLFHGTASRFKESIMSSGLNPGNRLYVHLSENKETALNVGRRHGKPVLLEIDTAKMKSNKIPFYLSENNVWLTDSVPTEYIKEIQMSNQPCIT